MDKRSRFLLFLKKHTPAGRYLLRVEIGTAQQEARLIDKDQWPYRLRQVVAKNSISGHIEQLLMGR